MGLGKFLNSVLDHDEDTVSTKLILLARCDVYDMEDMIKYISHGDLDKSTVFNTVERMKIIDAIKSDMKYSNIWNTMLEERENHIKQLQREVDQKFVALGSHIMKQIEEKATTKEEKERLEKFILDIENNYQNGVKGNYKIKESMVFGGAVGAVGAGVGASIGTVIGAGAGVTVAGLALPLAGVGVIAGLFSYWYHRYYSQKEFLELRPIMLEECEKMKKELEETIRALEEGETKLKELQLELGSVNQKLKISNDEPDVVLTLSEYDSAP